MKPEIDSGDLRQHNSVATHSDRWSISSGRLGFVDDHDASNYTHIFHATRHDGKGRGLNANLYRNNLVPGFGYWDLDHRVGYTHIFNNTRHDGRQGELNANIQKNNIAPRFGYWEDHSFDNTHIFNYTRHYGQHGELNANTRFGKWDHRFGNTHIMSNSNSWRSDEQNGNNLHPRRNSNYNNTRLRREGGRKETKTRTTKHRKSPMKNRNPSKVGCFSWIKRGWSLIF